MRSLAVRPVPVLLPALFGAIVLATACATSDDGTTTNDLSANVAGVEVAPGAAVIDPDHAMWGDAAAVDRNELLAFFAETAARDAGDDTIAVSFTGSNEAPPAGHDIRALRLRSGHLLAGQLVSDDGATVEFAFETAQGIKGTTRVAYAEIHPESVAELMLARADQGDSGALMEIAEYAAREGLYELARAYYLAAAEQDSAVADIAERRLVDLAQSVSDAEVQRGMDALEGGDDASARRILRRVQHEFSGTPVAEDAAATIAAIDARLAAKKLDAAREKRLTPIRELLADADQLTGEGLSAALSPEKATRSYLAARSKADSARRRIPPVRRVAQQSGDDETLAALEDLERRLDSQDVDNETQLATAYLERGDFTRARQAATAVLALDAGNREALALLGQISAAQEELRADTYDAWWYRQRRRYRVYPYPHRWYPRRGVGWGTIRRTGSIRSGTGGYTRPPIGVFGR